MKRIAEVFREFSDLNEEEIKVVTKVSAYLQLVADLSYSDILLFSMEQSGLSIVVAAHYSPNTAISIYDKNQLGKMYGQKSRPLVFSAFKEGKIKKGKQSSLIYSTPLQIEAVPIRFNGKKLAVLSRETNTIKKKRASEMEIAYMDIADEMTRMIFYEEIDQKLPADFITAKEAGDGIIKINQKGRITYATPNAVSIYKQLGITQNLIGRAYNELGTNEAIIQRAIEQKKPIQEIEKEQNLHLLKRVIPLVSEGKLSGAISIVRDISDIKDREDKLRTKEVIIKEIHHRVKNNLQSIVSLLRMQLRRTDNEETKFFLQEGINRIESIAVVHDILSHSGQENVDFKNIVEVIINNIAKQVTTDCQIEFRIEGDSGQVPSRQATSLALTINELTQNAIEHAFIDREKGLVKLEFTRNDKNLEIKVTDDGVGLKLEKSSGLGLQIVRNLIEDDLKGTISVSHHKGTEVLISVPLDKEKYFEEVI